MKNTSLFGLLMACLFTVPAQATLYDRGNGMIYDDVLDITWLRDANYAATQYAATGGLEGDADGLMNWTDANTWANNLSYGGYDDWRLASANLININTEACIANDGSCDGGFNNTTSEMGHMFYNNLGNLGFKDASGFSPQPGYGLSNTSFIDGNSGFNVSLLNMQAGAEAYWMQESFVVNFAWTFILSTGEQNIFDAALEAHGWVVRDGDVTATSTATTIEDFDDQMVQGFFQNDVTGLLYSGGPYATFSFEELVPGSGNFAYRIEANSPFDFPSTASAGVDGFTDSDYTIRVNVTQWNADTAFVIGGLVNFGSGYVFACVTNGCQLVRLDDFIEDQLAAVPVLLDPNHVYRMEISRGGVNLAEHRAALYDLSTGGNLVVSLQATDAVYATDLANPLVAVQALPGPADSPLVVAYFDDFIVFNSYYSLNVPIPIIALLIMSVVIGVIGVRKKIATASTV